MAYSSEYLERLRTASGVERGEKFDLVIAVDFYDGPEDGFAFYSSGEALSFSAVAESKYPVLRAFAFVLLDGNWARMAQEVIGTSNSSMVFASKTDSVISALMTSVSQARE